LTNSTQLAPRGFWLPSAFLMSSDDVRRVCNAVRSFYGAGVLQRAEAA
jgi:dTDP-4-amino-4,6-dideoxygalactose transaminase